VNDEQWMRWSIKQEVDGVITDDPKKYLEVCKNYDRHSSIKLLWRQWASVFFYQTMAIIFSVIFGIRHGFRVDVKKAKRTIKEARAR